MMMNETYFKHLNSAGDEIAIEFCRYSTEADLKAQFVAWLTTIDVAAGDQFVIEG